MSRTKIVATIGPACGTVSTLESMIREGVSVFRMNFSHGSEEVHKVYLDSARKAALRLGREVMIFGDLPGPKIRLGAIAPDRVQLKQGDSFFLTAKPILGSAQGASVNYRALTKDIKKGHVIALNDGAVFLRAIKVSGDVVECVVETGGPIASRKGVNFPGIKLSVSGLTAADRKWINFAVRENLDALALSFVRVPEDVRRARRVVAASGGSMPLIAKIEKHEAVERLEEIVEVTDGAMAARGDLGVEIPLEQVPAIQKRLLTLCNRQSKPVITATQMLESMIVNSRPTRAEVSDVANAILDGSDAIMLSGETAIGAHPVEVVRTMARVAKEADRMVPDVDWLHQFSGVQNNCPDEAISHSVVRIAERIEASAILCLTISGATPRRIARYRPRIPIFAFSARNATLRQLQLTWGVVAMSIERAYLSGEISVEGAFEHVVQLAVRRRMMKKGQRAIVTAGIPLRTEGNTNIIRVIEA